MPVAGTDEDAQPSWVAEILTLALDTNAKVDRALRVSQANGDRLDKVEHQLEKVEHQTTKTNGRVSALEYVTQKLADWQTTFDRAKKEAELMAKGAADVFVSRSQFRSWRSALMIGGGFITATAGMVVAISEALERVL